MNDLEKIELLKNMVGLPDYNTDSYQESKIQILPDKSISLGKFKASKIQQGIYYTHPDTLKAMKKNIFLAANNNDETQEITKCTSCKQTVDKQFWHVCPYCLSGFNL